MQIIAFDYGEKKIGVAVGQTATNTSSPLQIIFNKENNINWVSISSILDEWKPDLILIGKPLNMDGSESEMMKKKIFKIGVVSFFILFIFTNLFLFRNDFLQLPAKLIEKRAVLKEKGQVGIILMGGFYDRSVQMAKLYKEEWVKKVI